MGNRNAAFKAHVFDDEQFAFLSLVGPKQNLTLSFETIWPEMLYVVFSLESFIRDYQKKHKATAWDPHVAQARIVQSAIFSLVEEAVTPRHFTSFKKWIAENSVGRIIRMNNSKEVLKTALLSKLTEVAVEHPEYLMMSVTECLSILAMQQFSGEEIAAFTREAFNIVDTYTIPEMLETGVARGSSIIQ